MCSSACKEVYFAEINKARQGPYCLPVGVWANFIESWTRHWRGSQKVTPKTFESSYFRGNVMKSIVRLQVAQSIKKIPSTQIKGAVLRRKNCIHSGGLTCSLAFSLLRDAIRPRHLNAIYPVDVESKIQTLANTLTISGASFKNVQLGGTTFLRDKKSGPPHVTLRKFIDCCKNLQIITLMSHFEL